ncbi:MAG: ABC transporter permease [Candidatus Methylacidiphilales bacterium]|nr:ABC transporter permease [Candidatus Methylacidiphilales bacterium]
MNEGVRDIAAHKFRSFLTILGVVFGVSSLMTMFAITAGMAASMRTNSLSSGEAQKLKVNPSAPPARQRDIAQRSPGITYRDVRALRGVSPWITWICPVASHNTWVSFGNKGLNGNIIGTEEGYLEMEKMSVQHGRFLSELDQANRARVAVLGSRFWSELFPGGPATAVGQTIKIQGVSFEVVGTFPEYLNREMERARAQGKMSVQEARRKSRAGGRGGSRGYDPYPWKNQVVIIPITTMQGIFKSAVAVQNEVGPDLKLDYFQVGLSDPVHKPVVAEQLRNVLRVTHRGIDDVEIETYEETVGDVEKSVRAARLSGGIIAGIGLVVGGLGICNIMLAGIVERIREIGVRLALGATPVDVFVQVLMEAFLLALVGGVLGVACGYGMVYLLDDVLRIPNEPIVEGAGVGLSFAFALATGIIAGLYPSFKAARLQPVQALKAD